jgi:hypothetical protein
MVCLMQCVACSSSLGVVGCDDDDTCLISERRGFSCWNEELIDGSFDVGLCSKSESVVDERWCKSKKKYVV